MIEDDCLPWTLPCEISQGLIFLYSQMRRGRCFQVPDSDFHHLWRAPTDFNTDHGRVNILYHQMVYIYDYICIPGSARHVPGRKFREMGHGYTSRNQFAYRNFWWVGRKRIEITWNETHDMKWSEITWNEMKERMMNKQMYERTKQNEMKWSETKMKWNEMNKTNEMNEMKWTDDMKMKLNEMKWMKQMKWMKWKKWMKRMIWMK